MNEEIELILNNTPLDYELSELLEEPARDYLVLWADGKRINFYGTPVDSPDARREFDALVRMLHDRDSDFWDKFYMQLWWQFEKLFDLPLLTSWRDFRPEFTYKVHRTCAGYSMHLYAAVQLFEKLKDDVFGWSVSDYGNGSAIATIVPEEAANFSSTKATPAEAIATAVRDYLLWKKERDRG